MNYYHYYPDANHFAGVGLLEKDWDVIQIRNVPLPITQEWQPIVVEEFEDNPPRRGDFPSLSDYNMIPIMSARAWEVLKPLIGNCCEALPIIYPEGLSYSIIHVMNTIDALDVEKSEVWINDATGRVSRIYQYALREELLKGQHIFKLPLESGGELFVSDVFRKAVESNGLQGLLFRELPMKFVEDDSHNANQ